MTVAALFVADHRDRRREHQDHQADSHVDPGDRGRHRGGDHRGAAEQQPDVERVEALDQPQTNERLRWAWRISADGSM
jgi:hypothetical protein